MFFFQNYYKNIVNYDLINKFNYINIIKLPTIQKFVLTITTNNINKLTSTFLFLELITGSKCYTLISKKPNMSLKIQAGNPIGCKVTLRKKKCFNLYPYCY